MMKIAGSILCFFGLFYIYDILDEIKEMDQKFAGFKRQNCAFVEQFSRHKQCQTLMTYQYKTIIEQNGKINKINIMLVLLNFGLLRIKKKLIIGIKNLIKVLWSIAMK